MLQGQQESKVRNLPQTEKSAKAAKTDVSNGHGGAAPSPPSSSRSKYSSSSGIWESPYGQGSSTATKPSRVVIVVVEELDRASDVDEGLVLIEC